MHDILHWRVGDVRVTCVPELELVLPHDPETGFLPAASPAALARIEGLSPDFVTPDGALRMAFQALLVDAPGLRLVVDTCIGNDRVRAHLCEEPLQTDFLERLAALGWAPETVDAVLCTHMHVDHVGWNTRLQDGAWVPTFPNATYYFARTEYEHFLTLDGADHAAMAADAINPVIDAGLAAFVEQDHRFSREVSLRPTPGHTPGHVSVVLESGGERAIISGDAVHHPCQLARPHWFSAVDHDRAVTLATRLALLGELADAGDLLIGTHFTAPTAGRVLRAAEAFRFAPDYSKSG